MAIERLRNLILVLAAFSGSFCFSVNATGSIFDDQNPNQAPIVPPTAAPTPVKPAAPIPAAPQRFSPPLPHPTVMTPAPAPSANTTTLETGLQAKAALKRAKSLAALYLQQAEADVQALLDANQQYLRQKQELKSSETNLENVRLVGTPEQKLRASADYTRAVSEEKRMREEAYSGSDAYQEAKAMDTLLNPPLPTAVTSVVVDRKSTIANAIENRELIEGMTIDEANRAARARGVLSSAENGQQIFHWDIKGQVGSHRIVSGTHASINGGPTTYDYTYVPDIQTIAYVEAIFVDGKLTSFHRVDIRAQ